MLIEPNSTIRFYRNMFMNNSYEHTLHFNNVTEQNNYFANSPNLKRTFSNYSYQRVNKNTMRVECKPEDIYDCNYMCFQNTSFGNKWFYAFIIKVDYINNITSEITYEIDVIQTYLLDVTLTQCYVDREHSKTDGIGDNLENEGFNTDEMIYTSYGNIEETTTYDCIVGFTDAEETIVNTIDETKSGTIYLRFQATAGDNAKLETFLSDVGDYTKITLMYMIPHTFFTNSNNLATYILTDYTYKGTTYTRVAGDNLRPDKIFTLPALTGNENFNYNSIAFTPKNKKMYTYPYNYLQIDNGTSKLDLKFEMFTNLIPTLKRTSNLGYPPSSVLTVKNYKGSLPEYLNGLSLNEYPMCSFSGDTFSRWVNNSFGGTSTQLINSWFTLMLGIATGNPLLEFSGGVGAFRTAVSTVGSYIDNANKADELVGNNSGGNQYKLGFLHYSSKRCYLHPTKAKIIDDYFTRYGYKCNKIKVPEYNNRERWNYIKTVDCTAIGSCPSDDIKKIQDIFNKGITFWSTHILVNHFGDYTQSNDPI